MNISAMNKWISDHPTFFAVILLLIVCASAFLNSLNNGFLMDDYPMLIGNRSTNILQFLQIDVTGHEKIIYFRPVYHFHMLATIAAFGNEPFGYNLVNLILHYLTCLSVYYLFRILFKDPMVALLTSLIYCLHPINGILINHKICAALSFLVLATNLCLTNYLSALEEKNNFSNYLLSIIWFLLAVMCHETAILAPVFLMNILFVLKKYSLRETLVKSAPLLMTLLLYVLFRMYFYSLKKNVLDNISFFQLSLPEYIACYAKLISWYLSKLIYPKGIVLAWEVYRLTDSPFPWVISFFTAVALLLCLVFLYWKRSAETFALLWLLSGIALVSIVCFARPALGFVIEPHWLCASSVGFFLLVALFLVKLRKTLNNFLWTAVVIALSVFLFSTTLWYNQQWHSQKQYCQYWLKISPHSYWPNFWLGYTYFEEKNYTLAKKHYEKILDKGVRIHEVYGNLGIIEYNLGNYDLSIARLEKTMAIEPNLADTHYYLGLNYLKKNDLKKAEQLFIEAVKLDPYFVSPLQELAVLYEKQGLAERAALIRNQLLKLNKK